MAAQIHCLKNLQGHVAADCEHKTAHKIAILSDVGKTIAKFHNSSIVTTLTGEEKKKSNVLFQH